MSVVFKCKMCGGDLDVKEGSTIAECLYCGRKQTLPKIDDDKRRNLYDRANYFRQNGDFDKAMTIYEQILSEDNTDAEAYWSLVLCRYGIEYVEDPATHQRVPTVNRTQPVPVTSDEDYKQALHYADDYQTSIYEEEAKAIDEIQKGILEISRREKAFDVFICYKESDNNGQRTPDSVLAVDLYDQLTKEGMRVFCSRITLKDKLGQKYEPYIFSALNSAPVMVVIGTKPEYFNAVWVRNEWSRYLTLIKNGAKKILIPAYRDMSPYDLPEEFQHLQAQDMSRLGFMQDLFHGIVSILDGGVKKETYSRQHAKKSYGNVVELASPEVASLLQRAFIFLEDGDFDNANSYCEKVLDIDPENGRAYLGKLMAEMKVRHQEDLANCIPSLFTSNYEKALRFGDEETASELEAYKETYRKQLEQKNAENEQKRLEAERILKEKGITDFNSKDKNGETVLIKAVREGDTETAIALINFGVNDDKKDRKLRTALMWAAEKGHTEIAKALIDVRFNNDYFYLEDKDKTGWTALTLAAREGHTEIVNALIKTHILFLDTRSEDKTALEWAAANDHTETVKVLIEAGADINDNDGYQWKNALMYAAEGGHTEIVRALIDAGADLEANHDGWTALSYTARSGHTETVKALIDAGADLEANHDGWTALSYAARSGHIETVKALIDAGADVNGSVAEHNSIAQPLAQAIQNRYAEIVNMLLDAGAGDTPHAWYAADYQLYIMREKGNFGKLEGTDALKRLDEIFPYKPSASPATVGGCMTIIIEAFAIITALVAVGCLL